MSITTITTIVASIFCCVMLLLLFGKINLSVKFKKEVTALFAQSMNISNQTFSKNSITSLPEPVQRYFNHVLTEGQPLISYARIRHNGQFKVSPDKSWTNIKGEQYATTQKPGFIWKGTTSMFVARDMYISNKGRLIATLFSLYNIMDVAGDEYNQGELLRWLGESVLYPTNLLPSERLAWFPMDSNHAKLVFEYNGLSLFFNITFNEVGEITEMESKRHMGSGDLQTWVIKSSNYTKFGEVIVPTKFDVIWRLAKGDLSYARFNITQVEYNIPEKF